MRHFLGKTKDKIIFDAETPAYVNSFTADSKLLMKAGVFPLQILAASESRKSYMRSALNMGVIAALNLGKTRKRHSLLL
jgi:hypothetical protein